MFDLQGECETKPYIQVNRHIRNIAQNRHLSLPDFRILYLKIKISASFPCRVATAAHCHDLI